MLFFLISVVVFLILALIAIRISFSKTATSEADTSPILRTSGIYSIIRKDPKEQISQVKPTIEEIRKYIERLNVDNNDSDTTMFSTAEIDCLIRNWNESLSRNIKTIEDGDNNGVAFYYYDFKPEKCPVCSDYLKMGQYVTREEIFQHPQIIPPFHIGCTCNIMAHTGNNEIQDATEIGMIPLFKNEIAPRLPDWKMIPQSNAVRGTV